MSAEFAAFFRAATRHDPFPWQASLAERLARGEPPDVVAIPTGLGKTAGIVAAWTWALANSCDLVTKSGANHVRRVPMRLVHVSPRRVIVDQTGAVIDRVARVLARPETAPDDDARKAAGAVAERLRRFTDDGFTDSKTTPLVSARLRGGYRPEPTWHGRIDQPVAIASTSDLAGSGLLFRLYTGSASARPVIAGLLGVDACWVLDEAHLQLPLLETLDRVRGSEEDSPLGLPLWILQTTATPRRSKDGRVLELTESDCKHPVAKSRLAVSRRVRLVEVPNIGQATECLAKLAEKAAANRAHAVLVVADSVEQARQVHAKLANSGSRRGAAPTQKASSENVLLLHGQQREEDRRRVLERAEEAFSMDRTPSGGSTVYLVATNAIEVGADLSADHLVTAACPGDSLLQRLGRLGRRADAQEYSCDVVATESELKGSDGEQRPRHASTAKRIATEQKGHSYADATRRTVTHLMEIGAQKEEGIRVTTSDPCGLDDPELGAPGRDPMPFASDALRALVRTRPAPIDTPDVNALIHGIGDPDDSAYLAWRDDLPMDNEDRWVEQLEAWPLRSHELVSVLVRDLEKWLGTGSSRSDPNPTPRSFLCWEGGRASLVRADSENRGVVPGMVIVVPSLYGGHDGFGFNPSAQAPAEDIADLVTEHPKGPRLRLRRDRIPPDLVSAFDELLALFSDPDTPSAEIERGIRQLLRDLGIAKGAQPTVREAAGWLAHERQLEWTVHTALEDDADGSLDGWIGVTTRRRALDDDDELCLTTVVTLEEHQDDVARRAKGMAGRAGVPQVYVETVGEAGRHHDDGKVALRFQATLRGGSMPSQDEPPLAKSRLPRRRWRQAASDAGLARGFRHEALSAAFVKALAETMRDSAIDWELVAHLVGSSHGWGRPWFPSSKGGDEVAQLTFGGHVVEVRGNPLQEGVPQGAARFDRLNHEIGPWSLAWLEAALRLADQAASASYRGGDDGSLHPQA